MSVSLTIVSILILLVMFGAGQKILDNMRLTDKTALIILIAICIGLVIPPIWIGEYFCFSIGGFLIPLAVSIYLLLACGKNDLVRCLVGTILVAGIIYGLEWILPADPEEMLIDNMYLYGVVAGLVAYFLGKSRRNAFISCLFGITIAELVQWLINMANDQKSILGLGVGGAFSTYIVAIIISVALCEFIGRCVEISTPNKEKKVYNYDTRSYDSEKNGKFNQNIHTKENRIKNLENANHAKINRKNEKVLKNSAKTPKKEANNEI